MIKVSCIVPAHNEAKRIGNVLQILHKHPLIDEVIVVDDGSTDNTKDVVAKYDVKLIVHPHNLGKSTSVCTGIRESKGEYLIFIDGDLEGLSATDIDNLLKPVLNKSADVSISLRGNAPGLWKLIGLDYISGERVIPRSLFEGHPKWHFEELSTLPGFGLEVFLNKIIIKKNLRISVVSWPNVKSPFPNIKHGTFPGVYVFVKMLKQIFETVSIFGVLQQIIKMLKLKQKNITNELKLSLIIPAYNEEKYILSCIEHALKSSGGNFYEIIVVNNASTDRTHELVEKIPGVRVVYEPQKGLTKARQRGFLEAKGDILAYVDADTRMPPNWFNIAREQFAKNDNLVCLSGPYVYYDLGPFRKHFVKIYWLFAMPIYAIIGFMVVGGNFVIRKDTLVKMNGFDTSISFYGEDTDIARRSAKHGKVKFLSSFFIHTSGRRFSGEGFMKTGLVYIINFFSQALVHKSATKNYKDIR